MLRSISNKGADWLKVWTAETMIENSFKLDSETLGKKEISINSCECQRFSNSSKILSAFTSDEETQHLMSWMEGDLIFLKGQRSQTSSNGTTCKPVASKKCESANKNEGGRCPNRIGAAFCILNAIRDGANKLLRGEQQGPAASQSSSSDAQHNHHHHSKPNSPFQQGNTGYENEFPSISSATAKSATILKTRKKPKQKKNAQIVTSVTSRTIIKNAHNSKSNKNKQSRPSVQVNITKSPSKRRIRPTTLAAKIPESQSIWGVPSQTTTNTSQNLSSSSTTTNFIQSSSHRNGKWSNSISLSNTIQDPMERAMDVRQSDTSFKIGEQTSLMGSKVIPSFITSEQNDPMTRAMSSYDNLKVPQKDEAKKKDRRISSEEGTHSKDKVDSESGQDQNSTVESTDKRIIQIELDPHEKKRLTLISNRVSKVYCAIILNQMVPSLGMELQLVLRLLSLDDEQQYTIDQNTKEETTVPVLGEVFGRVDLCRNFSIHVLTRLRLLIGKFGNDILIPLLNLKPLAERIPCLEVDIRTSLDYRLEQTSALLLEPGQSGSNIGAGLGTSGKSTILTIPFQEKRDSRHNYRTKDLSAMFNNREQSRGAC